MSGSGCKVAVPYSFDSTPWANIPAVATDRYAFWITNPSMAMYEAMNLWCNKKQGKLAFQADSSYSSIQIWRFDPYQYCPLDTNGERRCPQDTSATFRVLPGFISDLDESVCSQRFFVLAPTIAFLDENNLAITVMETTFQNVDVLTLRPVNASLARSLRGVLILLFRVPEREFVVLLMVDKDTEHLKHLVHIIPNVKVLEDIGVHLVETVHPRQTTAHKRAHLQDAVLKHLLISFRVCLCDAQNTLAKTVHLLLGEKISERLYIPWHMPCNSAQLRVIERLCILVLLLEGLAKVAQLGREGHVG
jgi:hypothetical protein